MHAAYFVRMNGEFKPVPFDDILYISASRNYSDIFTVSKGRINVCVPLHELEKQLLQNLFCRIHRSHIISIPQISGYTYSRVSIGKKSLPIGKTYLEDFMRRTLRIQSCKDRKLEEKIKNMSIEEYIKRLGKDKKEH